jgi:ssDNA-binding Zn-finger/Zn-ribbon topoisomerase 1
LGNLTVWRDTLLKSVFIEKASLKHETGSVLYSNLPDKISVNDHLTFICFVHGEFKQKGYRHLEGQGCPECGRLKRRHLSRDTIFQRFYDYHGQGTYGYELLPDDLRNTTVIPIICKKHGIFYQSVYTHYSSGCPKCYHERSKFNQQTTKDDVIRRSHAMGFNLGYDLLPDRMNVLEYVTFVCPVHGEYVQQLHNHLYSKEGCRKCANEKISERLRLKKDIFLLRCQIVHEEGHYSYNGIPERFTGMDKINIHCNIHNHDFEQMARSHMNGFGCPICGKSLSKRENEIADFIKSFGFMINQGYRGWVDNAPRTEIDIYVPSLKVGFEYNGIYWHSSDNSSPAPKDELYHQNKQILAQKKGIDLFYIWEDTSPESQEIMIQSILEKKYVAEIRDGLIDKDLCPSIKYLPSGYQVEYELPPFPVYREYRKQKFLTYNFGLLKVCKMTY